MNNYFDKVITNNKKSIEEIEKALKKYIEVSANYEELQEILNDKTHFTVIGNKYDQVIFCDTNSEYSEYLEDEFDFGNYPFISYKVDFNTKKYSLNQISFPYEGASVILDHSKSYLYKSMCDSDSDSYTVNNVLCISFSHETNIIKPENCVDLDFDENPNIDFSLYSFYTAMHQLSSHHAKEIYEYIFENKNINKESKDIIHLTSDSIFDFDNPDFNQYRVNINELTLEYKKKEKTNKSTINLK